MAEGTPNPDGLFGVPGGAQVWEGPPAMDGNRYWYVVYTVPGTSVPMAWTIDNNDDLAAIFGPGNEPKPTRSINSWDEWNKMGALSFGTSRQLANLSEHPFDAFVANFTTEAAVKPWLRDPEILALTGRAILENRTVTESELAGTNWWKTHNETQRGAIAESNRDPATSTQKYNDTVLQMRQALISAGVTNPPHELLHALTGKLMSGDWTPGYVQTQISKLADPYAPGWLDPYLSGVMGDQSLSTVAQHTSKVDQLVNTWLGPAFGKGVSDQQRQDWAGQIRNDPSGGAIEEITEKLKAQRLVLFPEYQNENLSYDDIAGPWRGVVQQTWGTAPDELDPFFQNLVRLGGSQGSPDQPGGLAGVQTLLRREGRTRNIGTVVNDSMSAMHAAFGGSQRSVA